MVHTVDMTNAEKLVQDIREVKVSDLIAAFRSEHRTNQQTAFTHIAALLHALSDDYVDGHYDLRNEATVTAAHEAWMAIKDIPIPYI